jgi:hypothetical protein
MVAAAMPLPRWVVGKYPALAGSTHHPLGRGTHPAADTSCYLDSLLLGGGRRPRHRDQQQQKQGQKEGGHPSGGRRTSCCSSPSPLSCCVTVRLQESSLLLDSALQGLVVNTTLWVKVVSIG